ncbi:MAG: PilZ domain-containing protein [Deltaproteobacteria bacterium]|nr:PilZ domain-containing protein [Deltaproteobacteria bacterium]
MRARLICALCLAALALSLPMAAGAAKDTREERVRKFRDSLGEQVVRDSGTPVPAGERTAMIGRAALLAAGGIALLAGVHVLLSRIRARRGKHETLRRYLTENLMTPASAREHLQRVCAARIPLSVWIDDHFIKFSSRAEEFQASENACLALPLTPASGNDMLRKSGRIRVEYLFQQVPYHFDSSWLAERTEGGTFSHLFSAPDRIHFIQRRDFYRVEPPLSDPVACLANRADVPPMDVLDIGMGGFAVATSARFRPGEAIENCKIGGGNLLPLEVSAKCIYELSLGESKSKFRYRFGFQFTRLAEGGSRRLARFITKQQAASLSRRKAMER